MSINRKLKQNLKKMEKKQEKDDKKYFNQAYRPEAEVKLTGEEFMYLRKFLQDVRNERVIRVIDANRNQIGQGLPPRDMDIENVFGYVEQLHRKNVDAGVTVPIDVLRKEFEEEQKKENTKEEVDTVHDTVSNPEVKEEIVEVQPQGITAEVSSSENGVPEKKITFKEKVEEKESFRAE